MGGAKLIMRHVVAFSDVYKMIKNLEFPIKKIFPIISNNSAKSYMSVFCSCFVI